MRSRADQPSPDSSMTAASNSTQSGRARHPAHRARAQKPSVRGLGRWRRPMGNHLLPHRHRKAQQRRALCLTQRRPAAHDRRSSRQPPRRVPALELATFIPEPLAERFRQVAPRRARPCNPKNGFDKVKSRLSRPLQPGSPALPDDSGAIRSHWPSLNINRIKADLQFSALNQLSTDLGIPFVTDPRRLSADWMMNIRFRNRPPQW
jgi:hypothetical protein